MNDARFIQEIHQLKLKYQELDEREIEEMNREWFEYLGNLFGVN